MGFLFNNTPRKKDYITGLAIILFAIVLSSEILLVTWLPKRLMDARFHDKSIAREEMTSLGDSLRLKVRHLKSQVKTGEIIIVENSLNNMARHLHTYKDIMTRKQIAAAIEDLNKFEEVIRKWEDSESYVTAETLDLNAYKADLITAQ